MIPYDISDFSKNDEAFRKILDRFGKLDVVCLNAGRFYAGRVADDDFATIKKVFDINYFALVYIAKLGATFWDKTLTIKANFNQNSFFSDPTLAADQF